FSLHYPTIPHHIPSFPTRRSSDLSKFLLPITPLSISSGRRSPIAATTNGAAGSKTGCASPPKYSGAYASLPAMISSSGSPSISRSEEHTSELQSRGHLVCRLLLEK